MRDPQAEWMQPVPRRQQGSDRFVGVDATVGQFWRFALSDLQVNNARGYLAEFLVATALGQRDPQRIEWDPYDVVDGETRIEVKASAYLQAWEQQALSDIRFTGLRGNPPGRGGTFLITGKQYQAEVYVFAVQTAATHAVYDPLDVGQWDWYVLARAALEPLQRDSISLAGVRELTERCSYPQLAARIRAAARPAPDGHDPGAAAGAATGRA